VQRLASLLTTEALKSAPTVWLKAMLDLPPLSDMVKKEKGMQEHQEHLKIYKNFPGIMDLHLL
jgi:hypothetical protein